jgi:hypothetical protein
MQYMIPYNINYNDISNIISDNESYNEN